MTILQEKHLEKDNFTLHYYTGGNPHNELLIFLHPAFGDHTCFDQQMVFFAEKYHVISLDMLGHGKSQVRQGSVTIDHTADVVSEIIEREGHTRAHLVGVSLGSLIAQHTAHKYPHQAATVTVVGGYSIFGDNSEITRKQRGEMFRWVLLVLFSMERFRRYVASTTNVTPAGQAAFYQSARHFTRRSLRVLPGMQKVLSREDKRLTQPLLIIAGEFDLPIVARTAQRWHQQQPDSQFHIIPAAGHCANMDNAPEFNRVLAQFLADNRHE